MHRALSSITLATVVFSAGCSSYGPSSRPFQSPKYPVVLRGEAACTYRVARVLHQRVSADAGKRRTIVDQARDLGADAVVGYTVMPEYDPVTHRAVAFTYDGVAVNFIDPTDPECYKDVYRYSG